VLEYSDYRNFQTALNKAKVACENSGEVIHNHFVEATEMVETAEKLRRGKGSFAEATPRAARVALKVKTTHIVWFKLL